MGGKQGKQSFFEKVDTGGYRPFNFIRLSDQMGWLCGGSTPIFKESLEYLKSEGVGLIINTLLEPIKSGVNYNHVPYEFDEMSWTISDNITQELKEFEIVHVPIVNIHPFHGENSNLFLKTIREYHISHPEKSVYIASWGGSDRTHFAMVYTLMKLYKMSLDEACDKISEKTENLRLSKTQKSFLKGESLSDLDIYNSRPEIRTPQDHKCYRIDDEDDDETPNKIYKVAKSEVKYQHTNCAVCLHQCDDITGENFVEPIFRTLPEQIKKNPLVFHEERELEKLVPYMSQELGELSKLHILQNTSLSSDAIYDFAMTFRSDDVPDMITLIKRLGDYIVYFDRKGRGLMMDIGNIGGQVLKLESIYGSEGSPKNVFLYKDTAGDPILVGCRYSDYGIWRYKDTHKYNRVESYKDHDFSRKFTSGFKFYLTTTGKMVLRTEKGLYYASFTFKQKPYKKYKIILEEVPEDDMPLYKVKETFISVDSDKRYKIKKQLSVDSVPEEYLDKVASRGYLYDNITKQSTQVKEYDLHSVFATDKYDDIIIAGHDWGCISVWKAH